MTINLRNSTLITEDGNLKNIRNLLKLFLCSEITGKKFNALSEQEMLLKQEAMLKNFFKE